LIAALNPYREIFALPGFSRLLLTAGLSRLAGSMFILAIVLDALDRFRSPALAGSIAFASMAPGLIISPIAGALLDRVGSAKALVIDMVESAVLLAVLAGMDVAEVNSVPWLLAIVALYSLTTPLNSAGIRTLIPLLAPEHLLDRANALDTAIDSVVGIVGPALAGVLFGFGGGSVTLLVIAALFASAGFSLRGLWSVKASSSGEERKSLLAESMAGVRYVFASPTLRGLAVAYALYQVTWGALLVAVPVVVGGLFERGPADDVVTGLLWAGAGLAGAIGALIVGRTPTNDRERGLMVAGILVTAVAVYPIAVLFGLPGLAIGLAIMGFCTGPIDVGLLSIRQRRTVPGWRGRALTISIGLNMLGLPIGSAVGGWIAGHSVQLAFMAAALASAAAALAAFWLVPRQARSP
jgi:MFS family permease